MPDKQVKSSVYDNTENKLKIQFNKIQSFIGLQLVKQIFFIKQTKNTEKML